MRKDLGLIAGGIFLMGLPAVSGQFGAVEIKFIIAGLLLLALGVFLYMRRH